MAKLGKPRVLPSTLLTRIWPYQSQPVLTDDGPTKHLCFMTALIEARTLDPEHFDLGVSNEFVKEARRVSGMESVVAWCDAPGREHHEVVELAITVEGRLGWRKQDDV